MMFPNIADRKNATDLSMLQLFFRIFPFEHKILPTNFKNSECIYIFYKAIFGTSLAVQWLRPCSLIQGVQVRS